MVISVGAEKIFDKIQHLYDKPRQHIKKQRHYFANKGLSSQCYGFSSSHVWMWVLDHKERWEPKNWCFWTVLLEMTLESPLDYKRSNQSILKEINLEHSLEGLMLKLKLQYFGHLMQRTTSLEKTLMLGNTEGKRRRGVAEDEMIRQHESEQTPRDRKGQGSLVCYHPWSHKELDLT